MKIRLIVTLFLFLIGVSGDGFSSQGVEKRGRSKFSAVRCKLTSKSVADSTWTRLALSSCVDPDGVMTTGDEWKYTAPATGVYRVTAAVHFSATFAAGDRIEMKVYRSDGSYSQLAMDMKDKAGWREFDLTGTDLIDLDLNQGQYIDVRVWQDSGGYQTAGSYWDSGNYIAIERVVN